MMEFIYSPEQPCQDYGISPDDRAAINVAGRLGGAYSVVDPDTGVVDWDRVDDVRKQVAELAKAEPNGLYGLVYESLDRGHRNNHPALVCALRQSNRQCLGSCAIGGVQ